MKRHRILIVGDIHGYFRALDAAIKRFRPLLVLQCGDFGIWPRRSMARLAEGFTTNDGRIVPVHFCDGNHEDHQALAELRKYETPPYELGRGVYYQPRGSTITLPDGRAVLFAGGADSIDKNMRTRGQDWFPEELLTEDDFRQFPDLHVDMVVSHAAPASAKLPPALDSEKYPDPSRIVLDKVLQRYQPKFWYCAHYHALFRRRLSACRLYALDCGHGRLWKDEINKDGYALHTIRPQNVGHNTGTSL